MFRQVIAHTWADGVCDVDKQAFRNALESMRAIPELVALRWGDDAGHFEDNLDFVAVMDFDDFDSARRYVAHPLHQAFVHEHAKHVIDQRVIVQHDWTSEVDSFSVSVKGVVLVDGRVLLLKNERDEWELPGGRLESGETPEECVAREITEEAGIDVVVDAIIDTWLYQVRERDFREVFIVTYGCRPTDPAAQLVLSDEHTEIGLFAADEVAALPMPDGYKRSIAAWSVQTAADAGA